MDLKYEILAHLDIRALYHRELGELKNGRGDQALALCPFHEDTRASLSLNLKNGLWNCKACNAKGDVFSFIRKKYGTDFKGALSILAQEAGLEMGRGNGRRRGKKADKTAAQIVKTYDYYDADGVLVFQVCRTHPKGFFQRRPDGNGGWVNNLDEVVLVPYRLPEVLKAEMILIPEGEKDCDTLAELGLTCTCNPQGAGKWRTDYNEHFADKQVIIIPDNDDPGRKHAQGVARHLHGIVASVKLVELPDLPEKGDVSDWLKRGGTKEELLALIESTPEWTLPADQEQPITPGKDGKPAQSELLIGLAAEAEFFHTPDKAAYVTAPVDDHRETWPVGSKGFRLWLRGRFYKTFKNKAPNAQALQDALGVLESRALFDGPELPVHVRVAYTLEAVFVDLGTPTWEVAEITARGWQVVADPPVKFRRPAGLAPLPAPARGGTIAALRPFFNIRSGDWPLIASWLTACFSPGPYPILVTQGEQGSSKSTLCRMLRALIDPNTSPLRSLPREERDLAIAAQNCWLPAFDNVSVVPEWLSDGFCRLSTGGGLATRTLYTNSDETLFNSMRPLLLNGIGGLVHRQDLARRSIILELPAISETKRRPEASLWTRFEETRASILGALYDAVATALANHSEVHLPSHPAMADFATWAVAAEPALGIEPGSFLSAYRGNISEVVERSLAADPVASAVQNLMAEQEYWEGTPTELLDGLEGLVPERTTKMKTWPKAPHVLTNRLKRAATFLRAAGIEIEIAKSGNRKISIDRLGRETSVRSVHSVQRQEGSDNPPDASVDASTNLDASQNEASSAKARKIQGMDAQDASDAKFPTHSILAADDLLEGEI
jgi:5S rRNA maturation endonuclease (ribonuclease M5)